MLNSRREEALEPSNHVTLSTFVVRLWREARGGAWRGEIVHLQSRESAHFSTFTQMDDFISQFAPAFGAPRQALGPGDGGGENVSPK